MKKNLLFLFLAGCFVSNNKLNAQCQVQIQNMGITQASAPIIINSTKCEYTFNLSFDMTTNGGFKYTYFHSWLKDDYPQTPIFNCDKGGTQNPGTSEELGTAVDDVGKSFLDLGFEGLNNVNLPVGTTVDVTNNIATVYGKDPTVILTQPANSPGMGAYITRINNNTLHFDLVNVRIIINQACGAPILALTDVWGSNMNPPWPKGQCYTCGLAHFYNDPIIALQKSCSTSPFKFAVGLTSLSTSPIHVTYKVYLHDPALGSLPSPSDPVAYTSASIALSASSPYSSGLIDMPNPYGLNPYDQYGIYVQVAGQEFSNIIQSRIIDQPCAALPINLKLFTAERKAANVSLKWTTVTEENNNGFEIQRKSGFNDWQTVAFVNSKAINGNSSTPINYDFTDQNNIKGISQYRLKQIDIDRKLAFSQVRSIRGEDQKGNTIVYPNPSNNGKLNIIFEDVNVIRNVTLIDMNGRTIKQWKGVTNNNIQIENLNAGFYSIRIVNTETGEQVVEKVVVNKR